MIKALFCTREGGGGGPRYRDKESYKFLTFPVYG
jgi:hypothetical protein